MTRGDLVHRHSLVDPANGVLERLGACAKIRGFLVKAATLSFCGFQEIFLAQGGKMVAAIDHLSGSHRVHAISSGF